jgi:hypothetical protein
MARRYEQAVSALYRAPHESFVSERKRLAAELKAEGDKLGAARLAKMGRPPISAWAVNQLWWHAREAFDELFDTAAQLRAGKLAASPAHRQALARLGLHAQRLLSEGGHSANDATMRRVTMTLAGLAAAGSFGPDEPGALSKDRDPPGFEAFGIDSSSSDHVQSEPAAREQAEAAALERKREAEAAALERKREAEAQAKREAQRKNLEGELRDAKAELADREQERDRVAKQLALAEREVERARAGVAAAQADLEAIPR